MGRSYHREGKIVAGRWRFRGQIIGMRNQGIPRGTGSERTVNCHRSTSMYVEAKLTLESRA